MNNEPEQPIEAAQSSESEPESLLSVTKISVLTGLIQDLHYLILILSAAVYYLDCFSLLLLIRFLGQNQSTTAGVRVVAAVNVVCFLTHLLHSIVQPEPREVWNHGGVLVDFVGEKPPSRFKLLAYDLLIVVLQILHLALYYKKTSIDGTKERDAPAPVQDLEAEEAGISRTDPPTNIETEGGIEMQSLLPEGSNDPETRDNEASPDDTAIILRKKDFKKVFLNTNPQTEETSAVAVRRFIDRVNTIRARRAELEAQTAPGTTTATAQT